MGTLKHKRQKNKYRRLNSTLEISNTIGLHKGSIDKVYFTEKNPKKLKMGRALDIGVFVMRHNISIPEVLFMVDFIRSHKEHIKANL